ncbi:MAG: DUF1194 domain-containing protein [Pseudomonadota bacterium]
MIGRHVWFLALSGLILAAFSHAARAEPIEVDVELVLAVDVSQSIDEDERRLQRDGYVAAIRSPEFIAAVETGPVGRVAMTFIEWGSDDHHMISVDWRLIETAADAAGFAVDLAAAPLTSAQRTSISAALAFAGASIETNGFEGLRKVIDVSGDGPNNQGGGVEAARDVLVGQGVQINGLPIMIAGKASYQRFYAPMDDYYRLCVIGGPGAFVIPVTSPAEFADAIRAKLVLELVGIMPGPVLREAALERPVQCDW